MTRVVVAMSGGVDSSVAALLLVEKGYEVVGVTMQIWPEASEEVMAEHGGCCSLSAAHDARRVCDQLSIPHYVVNLKKQFEESVINDFASQYALGRTPNPCIVCNRVIKWEHLMRKAISIGASYIATGHYARTRHSEALGRHLLLRARKPEKDQSYALFSLTQDQLSRTMFPVGDLSKPEVRALASKMNIPTSDKPDSQDICFVVEGRYTDFLKERNPGSFVPGKILDKTGRVIGTHQGTPHFTVGQRKGIGGNAGRPLYVLEIRPEDNTVIVGTHEESLSDGLLMADCNWISIPDLKAPISASVKIRYRSELVACTCEPVSGSPDRAIVWFDSPQRAVTPGQAAVLYDGDLVIGGGTIERPQSKPR